jgi:flagellar basal-body rod protein FlgB
LPNRRISDDRILCPKLTSPFLQRVIFGALSALNCGMKLDQTGLQLGNFMSYLSQRQEVISSNLANADTPGYLTRDVEMPIDLSASGFAQAMADAGTLVVDTPDLPRRNDGNNVSIDRESRLLAENTMKFSVASQLARTELKNLRSAIQEGRQS